MTLVGDVDNQRTAGDDLWSTTAIEPITAHLRDGVAARREGDDIVLATESGLAVRHFGYPLEWEMSLVMLEELLLVLLLLLLGVPQRPPTAGLLVLVKVVALVFGFEMFVVLAELVYLLVVVQVFAVALLAVALRSVVAERSMVAWRSIAWLISLLELLFGKLLVGFEAESFAHLLGPSLSLGGLLEAELLVKLLLLVVRIFRVDLFGWSIGGHWRTVDWSVAALLHRVVAFVFELFLLMLQLLIFEQGSGCAFAGLGVSHTLDATALLNSESTLQLRAEFLSRGGQRCSIARRRNHQVMRMRLEAIQSTCSLSSPALRSVHAEEVLGESDA